MSKDSRGDVRIRKFDAIQSFMHKIIGIMAREVLAIVGGIAMITVDIVQHHLTTCNIYE